MTLYQTARVVKGASAPKGDVFSFISHYAIDTRVLSFFFRVRQNLSAASDALCIWPLHIANPLVHGSYCAASISECKLHRGEIKSTVQSILALCTEEAVFEPASMDGTLVSVSMGLTQPFRFSFSAEGSAFVPSAIQRRL